MEIKISHYRNLSLDELYAILRIRQEVFVVEQKCAYLDCDGKDQESYHLMLQTKEQGLAGYCRVLPAGLSYAEVSIGRVVSSPHYRGRGAGRLIMQHALTFIKATYGNVPVRIGAQSYLLSFYQSFGFEPLEPYIEDGIPHTMMLLKEIPDQKN